MKPTICSQCGEKILSYWTVCPVCAVPFADAFLSETNTIHCVQCGAIVGPDAQICSQCHVLIVRRYCTGCSRLIPDQTSICPYCATPASAKRNRLRSFVQPGLILTIPVCVIAAFVFVIYRVSQDPLPPPEPLKVVKPVSPQPAPVATIVPPIQEQKPKSEDVPASDRARFDSDITAEAKAKDFAAAEEETGKPDNNANANESLVASPDEPRQESETKPEREVEGKHGWLSRGTQLKQGRKLTHHASLLMQKGRYSDASIVLRDALRAFPPRTEDLTYGEALFKLGICLRRKGQPEQAIPVLQQALRFPYYRTKVLREVEAATSQLRKVSRVKG